MSGLGRAADRFAWAVRGGLDRVTGTRHQEISLDQDTSLSRRDWHVRQRYCDGQPARNAYERDFYAAEEAWEAQVAEAEAEAAAEWERAMDPDYEPGGDPGAAELSPEGQEIYDRFADGHRRLDAAEAAYADAEQEWYDDWAGSGGEELPHTEISGAEADGMDAVREIAEEEALLSEARPGGPLWNPETGQPYDQATQERLINEARYAGPAPDYEPDAPDHHSDGCAPGMVDDLGHCPHLPPEAERGEPDDAVPIREPLSFAEIDQIQEAADRQANEYWSAPGRNMTMHEPGREAEQ